MHSGLFRRAHVSVDAVRAALADLHVLAPLLGLDIRSARGGVLHCPFHADANPSFSLFPSDSGGWAGCCHSTACGVKGDALALVGRKRGLDMRGAGFARLLEQLRDDLGLAVDTPAPRRRLAKPPAPTARRDDTAERYAVQERIHRVLLDVAPLGDEGRTYMARRGFLGHEVPADDWCLLPPPSDQRRVVEAIVDEIRPDAWRELSGLASSDGRSFAHPYARLVIPWRSNSGVQAEAALLQRRRLDDERPKYVGPAGISAPWPFGVEDFEIDTDETVLVIVEGALDVIAVRALALTEGLAWLPLGIPGTSAWRREWATLGAGRDVIVGLDADAAGHKAVEDVALDLADAGARVSSQEPVHGKDWTATLAWLRREPRASW